MYDPDKSAGVTGTRKWWIFKTAEELGAWFGEQAGKMVPSA